MAKQKDFTAPTGKVYKFQHPGVLNYTRAKMRCKDEAGRTDEKKLLDYIHEYVIVEPKVDWAFWDDNLEDFEETTKAAINFLRGKSE
ncbi:hypothetical protein SAMN05192534_12369 [Alteribacillus persepolensis]|uniref:Uncharacterized protein n=1 Tax=Alteribacillus persepolensis TaxID=568899 RepID=A0A1G8IB85_9BACI|nr:hypothetical protein [Alteribacillus persepolensis]SDI16031.1 hypothetical protein SAMN05192534_12369 [Alteribacillus persepolensis]